MIRDASKRRTNGDCGKSAPDNGTRATDWRFSGIGAKKHTARKCKTRGTERERKRVGGETVLYVVHIDIYDV